MVKVKRTGEIGKLIGMYWACGVCDVEINGETMQYKISEIESYK